MKEYLEKQRNELEEKKKRLEMLRSGSPDPKGSSVKSGARKLFGK